MAEFPLVSHLDYHAHVEDYNPTDGRWRLVQLAPHARTSRHPNAPFSMRRQLLPDEFLPCGGNRFRLDPSPAYSIWDSICAAHRQLYCSMNNVSRTKMLRGCRIPSRINPQTLIRLRLSYPPVLPRRLLRRNFLLIQGTKDQINSAFTMAQDLLHSLLVYIAKANRRSRKITSKGGISGWLIDEGEEMQDDTYREVDRDHIPHSYDLEELENLLKAMLEDTTPGPTHPRASYVTVVDEAHIELPTGNDLGVLFRIANLRGLHIGMDPSPFDVPVLLLPGLSSPALRGLYQEYFPAKIPSYNNFYPTITPDIVVLLSPEEAELVPNDAIVSDTAVYTQPVAGPSSQLGPLQ